MCVSLSSLHLLQDQAWKDQSGFPAGPVWQTATLSLGPLRLRLKVWKVRQRFVRAFLGFARRDKTKDRTVSFVVLFSQICSR